MILILATRYRKCVAFLLFFVAGLSFDLMAMANEARLPGVFAKAPEGRTFPGSFAAATPPMPARNAAPPVRPGKAAANIVVSRKSAIGGPNQPEMTSFKSVSNKDMVDLFTGQFSYNIPLLDVGGYPVNIYYNGEVGMEQEASWVGLGWNINPGSITRNMRGVPDDFNGTDQLIQEQNVKPNKTYGITLGSDVEINGYSGNGLASLGVSIGVSWNNRLGPALNTGFKGALGFQVADRVVSEKAKLELGAGIDVNIGSRSGFSLSPNVSLMANVFDDERKFSVGTGLSTTYNSREGIKALQISEQVSANRDHIVHDHSHTLEVAEHFHSGAAITAHSSVISFARPSYIPTIRMPMLHTNISGNFQFGAGLFGGYDGTLQIEAFSEVSKIDPNRHIQTKPMYGYLFYEKANGDQNGVSDFTRFNDREVTPHTPIISAPQYSYDVFTIQGEGTGGSVRAFRTDPGTVRDNFTGSSDNDNGIGADIGPPGHYGVNTNLIHTTSTVGEWTLGNTLKTAIPFNSALSGNSYENVYFRNPSEGCVIDNAAFTRLGGTDLVRFQLSGDGHNPGIKTNLDRFATDGSANGFVNPALQPGPQGRQQRTQVVDFLSADDASQAGLDQQIYSYDFQTPLDNNNILQRTSIPRFDQVGTIIRRSHHISQINVTESNGKRYIYGLPVYNTLQKDYTFSVAGTGPGTPAGTDIVTYDPSEKSPASSPDLSDNSVLDGSAEVTTTPPYAHSFLLTGLLSPDYVDVTGDGITEDDLGQAVKFNYSEMPVKHKWRTPYGDPNTKFANFNPGNLSTIKDDKGLITYGEREVWYLHSIESKNMIALFTLEDRDDAKGVLDEDGGRDAADVSAKRLKQIDLYSKSDLRQHGLAGARPIKTVHFEYSYVLCPGTPDSKPGEGKLTLERIYFTYNGQTRSNKDQYVFSYVDKDGNGNQPYTLNASDRWGTYKPASMNPDGVKNAFYPYTPQDQAAAHGETPTIQSPKTALDANAGTWSLKRILLPSGGQLEIGYECNDYAFVQNRRAADVFPIVGFGHDNVHYSNRLYDLAGGPVENPYLFIRVPVAVTSTADVYHRYLEGLSQIAVKLDVNMRDGDERINSYAMLNDDPNSTPYGYLPDDPQVIWIKLKLVNNVGPLSLSAIEFMKDRLPGQAFDGYDASQTSGLEQIAFLLAGWLSSLQEAFKDPVYFLRAKKHKAQTVQLSQCFVRLNDPDGVKYGGGQRVRYITLKDNWDRMTMNPDQTHQALSSYSQLYDYTTRETFEGVPRTISSGVASYEPGIGEDENPFLSIVQIEDRLPLGPASYGAVEMPVLEPFFPAPGVGYSQVTVRSVSSIPASQGKKSRSGIGRQVTKFYTAKDFPVYYSNTGLDPSVDKEAHDASTTDFFYKYAFDARALSQGFLVATNDMHGKMQAQYSYADNDTTQLISSTENYYRNTGTNGLNETFSFVSSKQNGAISSGNMGIDVELMTDTREFVVKSNSQEYQFQVDLYPVLGDIPWLPFLWQVSGNSENDYRAVTTTKVITYHSVLDSVIVFDKGSKVSTRNLVYDGETGQVIVSRTINEFNQPIYTTNYPAWWAYDGMGPAYRNTGLIYRGAPLNFTDGRLINPPSGMPRLASGDELLITSQTPTAPDCPATVSTDLLVWVMDQNKTNPPFPVTTPNFIFIDKDGNPYNNTKVDAIRVIRSGRRNMLDEIAASVTSLGNPILPNGGSPLLSMGPLTYVLNASSVEFGEKWQTDKGVIGTYVASYDQTNCKTIYAVDCNGQIEKTVNPYKKGLLGTFRVSRNLVFYGNRNNFSTTQNVNLSMDGYLKDFGLYWDFSGGGLVPNTSSALWVESNRVNRVNAQGLELETKNALGIYTAAQYGFNKTLPLAITNNSPVANTAYAGFEDYGFNQGVDGWQPYPCSREPIDFTSMLYVRVASSDEVGFRAHTGKNMLEVSQSGIPTIQIPIVSGDNLNPSLVFGTNTAPTLVNPGVNVTNVFLQPSATSSFQGPPSVSFDNTGNTVKVSMAMGSNVHSTGSFAWDGYVVVPVKASYHFTQNVTGQYTLTSTGSLSLGATFKIQDINNSANSFTMTNANATASGSTGSKTDTKENDFILCPGVYHLTATANNTYFDQNHAESGSDDYTWTTTIPAQIYMATSPNGCTSTTGIPGGASQLNPLFGMPAGVPMVFSAWVHETPQPLPSGADTASGWYNNYITLSGVAVPAGQQNLSFGASGPLIDGWQRYEAKFIPNVSGTVTMNIFNHTGNKIYFDDIRIHPFNAEMKSYVYDPVSLRLIAELDNNNYATFYEYDEEGTPVRTKTETQRGIQTIKETRSAKQKNINDFQ